LRFDVAGNQVAVLRVDRNLTGTEQQVANAHGVIVRTDGGGRFRGFNYRLGSHDFKLRLLSIRQHNGGIRAGRKSQIARRDV
jgi:hypothetical protein